ncbi:MAG: TetR/AcrR family transcriptional regulator C-terminal domain-containing protein [Thermomicrobiales bacterium]
MTIADSEGIGALTMRRVAKELGVEAMALYYHVANKDDLLDGMIDMVFGEIVVPQPGGDWVEAMRQHASSARAVLLRHPWAVSLMDSRTALGPATLRHHEELIGLHRAAGLSMAFSAHIYALLDAFVYGFVIQEVALPLQGDAAAMQEGGDEVVRALPVEAFPNMHAFMAEHVMQPGYSFSAEFDFGLDLILRGLAEAARPEGSSR